MINFKEPLEFKSDGEPKLIEDFEKEEASKLKLREYYLNLIDLHKKYTDIEDFYYPILVCWEIGTYLHDYFISYPFLHFNGTKGGGKSRTMKLTISCSKDGKINNSMREAPLFRTKGTLGIDEFEGIGRKGYENLQELLNSAYKKGTKVQRMKKMKTLNGEEQVVEEFDVYRPIAIANIWGLDDVLGDRSIPIRLEKSDKFSVVNLIEIWEQEQIFIDTKAGLYELFAQNTQKNPKNKIQCRFEVSLHVGSVYLRWNEYVRNEHLGDTMAGANNDTKQHKELELFNKIKETKLNGRELELSFPLFLIAEMIGEDILEEVLKSVAKIMSERKEEQFMESKDILFLDFVAQSTNEGKFCSINSLAQEFKVFLKEDETEEKWINAKWIGRALKRLKLTLQQRRLSYGREVLLDIKKAQEKIKMFKK